MTSLFKKLPCSDYNLINEQLLKYVYSLNVVEHTDGFWNPVDLLPLLNAAPLFKNWLMSNQLFIKTVALTVCKEINCCGIHVDTPPARFKLSWPLLNTEQSYNVWFKEIGNVNSKKNYLGGTSYLDTAGLEEIGKEPLTGPCLIDAGIPHSVNFNSDTPIFPRLGLQCQLLKEPKNL